jgi:hypothetical protein
MRPVFVLLIIGAVIGAIIGSIIAVIRAISQPKDDRRRWGPAIFGGIIGYWGILLSAIFLSGWLTTPAQHSTAFNYTVGGIDVGLAVYVACLVSIAVAPRRSWRQMSYISAMASLAWTIYFDIHDKNFLGEMLSTTIGAAAAFATAYHLFGRTSVQV